MGYKPGIVPPMGCGNGVLEGTEQCDDGNLVSGDGCSALCSIEGGGGTSGGGTSSGGDDGNDGSGEDDGEDPGLEDEGHLVDRGCVCRARPGGGPSSTLGLVVLVLLARRRRLASTSPRR
jgi:MYXO-CTERM domain-containing protein